MVGRGEHLGVAGAVAVGPELVAARRRSARGCGAASGPRQLPPTRVPVTRPSASTSSRLHSTVGDTEQLGDAARGRRRATPTRSRSRGPRARANAAARSSPAACPSRDHASPYSRPRAASSAWSRPAEQPAQHPLLGVVARTGADAREHQARRVGRDRAQRTPRSRTPRARTAPACRDRVNVPSKSNAATAFMVELVSGERSEQATESLIRV